MLKFFKKKSRVAVNSLVAAIMSLNIATTPVLAKDTTITHIPQGYEQVVNNTVQQLEQKIPGTYKEIASKFEQLKTKINTSTELDTQQIIGDFKGILDDLNRIKNMNFQQEVENRLNDIVRKYIDARVNYQNDGDKKTADNINSMIAEINALKQNLSNLHGKSFGLARDVEKSISFLERRAKAGLDDRFREEAGKSIDSLLKEINNIL